MSKKATKAKQTPVKTEVVKLDWHKPIQAHGRILPGSFVMGMQTGRPELMTVGAGEAVWGLDVQKDVAQLVRELYATVLLREEEVKRLNSQLNANYFASKEVERMAALASAIKDGHVDLVVMDLGSPLDENEVLEEWQGGTRMQLWKSEFSYSAGDLDRMHVREVVVRSGRGTERLMTLRLDEGEWYLAKENEQQGG